MVSVVNDVEYEYDPNVFKGKITQNIEFKTGERFGNDGIFGDLFDPKRHERFGRPRVSSVDPDQVSSAKDQFGLP